VLLVVVLQDSFEALVLPRRVTRLFRVARIYYRVAWTLWRWLSRIMPAGRYRETILSVFGPLSLFGLFVCWIALLIFGVAFVHWGQASLPLPAGASFRECLYHSGETFFTLGYGDITPATSTGKAMAVIEAGMGFGFMAVIIGYLPVLYQAFS